MREIIIRIQVLDDGTIVLPGDVEEPPHMAEMPPITAAPPPAFVQQPAPVSVAPASPQCPTHGPMTFHAAHTKPDGKQVSARYSCDRKVDDKYCPTKAIWL